MSFDGGFDSLGFDADVSLSNGGGTVLQEPLDKCNVVPAGFVNLSGVPLAETVGADALKVPSRVMRKLVCRLRPNEVSRQ